MKKINHKALSNGNEISLHLLLNQLTVSTLPAAIKNGNLIINDVPVNLIIKTDKQLLASVLGSLLDNILQFCRNTSLQLTVKSYGDVVLLYAQADATFNHPVFSQRLVKIQELSKSLEATIGVTSFRNNTSTIAFSFINVASLNIPVARQGVSDYQLR